MHQDARLVNHLDEHNVDCLDGEASHVRQPLRSSTDLAGLSRGKFVQGVDGKSVVKTISLAPMKE